MKIEKFKNVTDFNRYCGVSFNFKKVAVSFWADLYNWVLIPTIKVSKDYTPHVIEHVLVNNVRIIIRFEFLCFSVWNEIHTNKEI